LIVIVAAIAVQYTAGTGKDLPTLGPNETLAGATAGSGKPTARTSTTTLFVHPVANPNRIQIPSIDVDAKIVTVGLQANGDMETPDFGFAGWYKFGPVPGDSGSAVIIAHVDSTRKPDVFYHLKNVAPGDEIYVYNKAGDKAEFVVVFVEQALKTQLPKERIWSDSPDPTIRLITCGGTWDRDSGHYLYNVIVYGRLVR
jgi:LPXTG-site transpeptidase (sortase) family protein